MSIPRHRHRSKLWLTLVGAVLLSAAGPISESIDEAGRLRAMSPELRDRLANQLKTFEELPRPDRDTIRALDSRLATESEEDRLNDYAVMRRYYLWVQSLPESQRNELKSAAPEKRFALVSKWRKTSLGSKSITGTPFYRYGEVVGGSPFAVAQRLKVWLNMTDKQRAEITQAPLGERLKQLMSIALTLDPKEKIHHPTVSEIDAFYEQALASGQYPRLKKFDDTTKEAQKKAIKKRFVENYYFVEHPPKKVNEDKLYQFYKSLPTWVTDYFLTLTAEDARHRATILYRLVNGDKDSESVKSAVKSTTGTTKTTKPASPVVPKAKPGQTAF